MTGNFPYECNLSIRGACTSGLGRLSSGTIDPQPQQFLDNFLFHQCKCLANVICFLPVPFKQLIKRPIIVFINQKTHHCQFTADHMIDERARSSTSKRRKSESRALNLGFDFSDEIKALIGEDGVKDFKLRIRKKLFQTDMNAHRDHFTMLYLQINEAENLLVCAEKTRICHGDDIGVTLVELGLGDEKDSTLTSQPRLKQRGMTNTSCYALRSSWNAVVVRNAAVLRRDDYVQIYSFRRNGELWLVLVKDSDHEEGRKDGVFGRRTLMEDGDGAN